jgi:hypothetical protein
MCLYRIIAMQRLYKQVPAAQNTHAAIEEFVDAYLCRRKVDDWSFSELLTTAFRSCRNVSEIYRI